MRQYGIKAIAVFKIRNEQATKEIYTSEDFSNLTVLRKQACTQEVDLMICEMFEKYVLLEDISNRDSIIN